MSSSPPVPVSPPIAPPPSGAVPSSGEPVPGRLARLRRAARANPLVVAATLLGLLVRVVYWQVTERRFEDGLITVTHARNLVDGIGLTHHPYEPVTHGFTSVVSVTTPIVGELAGEVWNQLDGFVSLRLASLVAFVLTIVLADRIARRLGVATWPRAFVLGFLAVDYNQVMYGMAGMETQIAVCVLLAAVDALMRRAVVATGLLCGLALLTRPDFALFVGPAVISMLLWRRSAGVRTAGLAAAVVLPWLVFATAYYGSAVPNTITAKSLRYHTEYPDTANPVRWIEFASDQVAARAESSWHVVTPFLNNGFVVDAPLLPFLSAAIAVVVIVLAVAGALATRRVRAWRAALVFVALFAAYRFVALPEGYYEWYYPPVVAIAVLCAGVALTRLRALVPRTSTLLAVGLVALFAWPLPAMVVLDSRLQHQIEDRVRVPMSLWLRDNVPPGRSVTSESAGYVGYFGRVKLLDYPGLTSPEALAIMQRLGPRRNSMDQLIAAARPDFVVLRPNELTQLAQTQPGTVGAYAEAARFAVPFPDTRLEWGGVAMVNIDREFIVLRRRDGA